jgi:hypothetical protein
MFSPQKANLRIGEITAAGIMKRIRLTPQGRVPPDPARATPAWKIWLAVLVFLGLLAAVAILTA